MSKMNKKGKVDWSKIDGLSPKTKRLHLKKTRQIACIRRYWGDEDVVFVFVSMTLYFFYLCVIFAVPSGSLRLTKLICRWQGLKHTPYQMLVSVLEET